MDENKVMRLWRQAGLPEYFLGNGGTNARLCEFAGLIEAEAQKPIPMERLALNVKHRNCHKAADAFWAYWNENGETHKRGYYEATWGAINQALRTVGVVEHEYMKAAADAIDAARRAR